MARRQRTMNKTKCRELMRSLGEIIAQAGETIKKYKKINEKISCLSDSPCLRRISNKRQDQEH